MNATDNSSDAQIAHTLRTLLGRNKDFTVEWQKNVLRRVSLESWVSPFSEPWFANQEPLTVTIGGADCAKTWSEKICKESLASGMCLQFLTNLDQQPGPDVVPDGERGFPDESTGERFP